MKTINKIRPVGNKILVRKVESDNVVGGIEFKNKGEKFGNAWYIIIALPSPCLNPWIKEMEVGGQVMAKEFDYDKGVNPDHDDDFAIIDVEPESGVRAGQVLAYLASDKKV